MTKWIFIITLCTITVSCTTTSRERKKGFPSFEKRIFGEMANGDQVLEYTLKNGSGIEMSVITYGGIIRTLFIPDNKGNFADVVLGYDSLNGYLNQNPYFGAIIGRYGNRIAEGTFTLDNIKYTLAKNNLGNHLHGGTVGFDKVIWEAEPFQNDNQIGLKMTYFSEHMEEGYPGNLNVAVKYILNNNNELIFEYEATTDKKTVINLTNHAYYNLAGKGDILSHRLKINAFSYLPVDETLIPTEIDRVNGTPFDFTKYKRIGKEIDHEDEQLTHGLGFDHCWVIDPSEDEMSFAASLVDPVSGRRMDIYTEEPGIQFYSGNFLDGTISGKAGVIYEYRSGLCLETQHFPNSPNRADFPSTTLNPGEIYNTKTVIKFLTQVN